MRATVSVMRSTRSSVSSRAQIRDQEAEDHHATPHLHEAVNEAVKQAERTPVGESEVGCASLLGATDDNSKRFLPSLNGN